ncbi:glycosylphosphatidylinositol-anchored high density lipoprotein-binding protein 1 isoform X1 [Sorex fumeus]|uniref:glycosylphosphatidylinositol-anchored high density lipoprotein-binding protein 1 isoform X1 n=1 Tax=Sorex fumeus TaxID=62283 RepID=UPI0024AD479F|nr:glycosylphosphatidylinositol-anchored high density lipoprotein-binding protein 1 isoform X1 [Sorex fumeus]
MKALTAALLALLLCGPSGQGQVQDEDEDEDDVDLGQEGYDDDDDDEMDEASVLVDDGRDEGLHCYSCQSLPSPESCLLRQRCGPRHRFCKTLVSHGDTESGPLTTYSAWCSDTCHPITKTVERTLMTVTCCESPLCNVPPWEGPEGGLGDPQWGRAGGARSRGVGGPWGCPLAVAMTLLLSLLCGIHFLGS